ncbi:hypothetical protein D3C79_978160 [compost metagenome]
MPAASAASSSSIYPWFSSVGSETASSVVPASALLLTMTEAFLFEVTPPAVVRVSVQKLYPATPRVFSRTAWTACELARIVTSGEPA